MKNNSRSGFMAWRFYLILGVLSLFVLGLCGRLFFLMVHEHTFLLTQGNTRAIRDISLPAPRGVIYDRNKTPLAISSTVNDVWADPKEFTGASGRDLQMFANFLSLPVDEVVKKLHEKTQYVVLKKAVSPAIVDQIKALNIPGIYFSDQFSTFYPYGEVTSQLVGLTDVNNQGQSDMEYAANSILTGTPGKEKALVNRMGHVVDVLKMIQPEKPGNDVHLSIDEGLQFEAYQQLAAAFKETHAQFGSIVVMDPKTGEVLAMVNQPSFNPNDKTTANLKFNNNHAVTSQFEPGSVMKTFAVVNALEQGETPHTMVDTNPGHYFIGKYKVEDEGQDYGTIDLTTVLQKSSNVGISKITLHDLKDPAGLYNVLTSFGFGQKTGSGFPGEVSGHLQDHDKWPQIDLADLTFGYGVSVTTLQLASAYAALANHGIKMPISLYKLDPSHLPQGTSVVSPKIADEVVQMLKSVLAPGGTGGLAQVPGYDVAGKTGTSNLAHKGSYEKHQYVSSFVGMAPAKDPKFVVAVVLYNDQGDEHFGGLSAGPAFSQVMGYALKESNTPPDDVITVNTGNKA